MKPQVGNTVVKTYRSVGNRTDLANGDNFYLKYVYNEAAILNDSEFKFYFIGLLAADGYISDKSNCIELCLKESDKDLLTILRDILVPGKNLVYKEKQKAYRLAIVNKVIADEVKRFINPSNKTFSLIFPYGIPGRRWRRCLGRGKGRRRRWRRGTCPARSRGVAYVRRRRRMSRRRP